MASWFWRKRRKNLAKEKGMKAGGCPAAEIKPKASGWRPWRRQAYNVEKAGLNQSYRRNGEEMKAARKYGERRRRNGEKMAGMRRGGNK